MAGSQAGIGAEYLFKIMVDPFAWRFILSEEPNDFNTLFMDTKISFTVNGKSRTITTDPGRPLLEVLREDLQLTGTKFGCGDGQCRACTVLINGQSTPSCITSVGDVDAQEVVTIEGLASGDKLHPVQEAFLAEGAFQCGYCTAGMIMGVVGALRENPKASVPEVLSQMQKHICRCGSYAKYLKAIHRAVTQTGGKLK
jgi:aerobic-type carbon monoxide dehydrogenase small subunit (CoxS/CutS family)